MHAVCEQRLCVGLAKWPVRGLQGRRDRLVAVLRLQLLLLVPVGRACIRQSRGLRRKGGLLPPQTLYVGLNWRPPSALHGCLMLRCRRADGEAWDAKSNRRAAAEGGVLLSLNSNSNSLDGYCAVTCVHSAELLQHHDWLAFRQVSSII